MGRRVNIFGSIPESDFWCFFYVFLYLVILVYFNEISIDFYAVKCFICINYCKRGYFRWGEISRKCWQDFSCGGNFHDSTHIPLITWIKSYGFYFRVGEIFATKAISRKSRKLPPRENFHVYSMCYFHVYNWENAHIKDLNSWRILMKFLCVYLGGGRGGVH